MTKDPITEARQLLQAADASLAQAQATTVPRGIHGPSHFTPAMAARALKLTKGGVTWLMRSGELAPEVFLGQKMIPAHLVVAAMTKRGLL